MIALLFPIPQLKFETIRTFFHTIWIMQICDMIWENMAYGEANRDFQGQPYSHIYMLFLKRAEIEKCVFSRCSLCDQKVQALIRRHAKRMSSD